MVAQEVNRSKNIAKNTIILYVSMIVILGITLVTSSVALKTIGAANFAIFNVIGGLILFLELPHLAHIECMARNVSKSFIIASKHPIVKLYGADFTPVEYQGRFDQCFTHRDEKIKNI